MMPGRFFILIVFGLTLTSGAFALAQAPAFPEEDSWTPIRRSGICLEDEEGDAMGYRDAVGDASFPAAYYATDAFYFYFRLRLDQSPLKNPAEFHKFAWGAACNVEGTLDNYQILVLLDGFADPDLVTLQKNLVQQVGDSPADVSEMLAASYPASTHARSQAALSNFGGDADFFVDWAVSRLDLSLSPFGLEAGATGRCVLGTSANRFSLQRDIVSPSGTETLSASYSDLYGCLEPLTCVNMEYGDGLGDACDGDDDNDGIPDGIDNSPLIPNPAQEDANDNGFGDISEGDGDGDGIVDGADNCPTGANADQHDLDGDWTGDVCDLDDDGDGVLDGEDNCPLVASADQFDIDGDGWGRPCDEDDVPLEEEGEEGEESDTDGDGSPDAHDNCPLSYNPTQSDANDDGTGDLCDVTTTLGGGGCGLSRPGLPKTSKALGVRVDPGFRS